MRAWRRGRRDCSVRGFDDLAAVALLLLLLLVCCSSWAPYFLSTRYLAWRREAECVVCVWPTCASA